MKVHITKCPKCEWSTIWEWKSCRFEKCIYCGWNDFDEHGEREMNFTEVESQISEDSPCENQP